MNAKQFSELIKDPNRIHDVEASDLKQLAHEYPFSQAVQFVYALRLKNSGEHLFNQQLGRTSIITEDRSILFDYFEKGGKTVNVENPNRSVTLNQEKSLENFLVENPLETEEMKGHGFDEEVISKPIEQIIKKENKPASPISESSLPEISKPKKKESLPEAEKPVEPAKPAVINEPVLDMSHLSASEKIKAILERSRKLQANFEEKKSGENQVNDRVKAIREKLQKIKSTPPVKPQDIVAHPAPKEPTTDQSILEPQDVVAQQQIDEEILYAIDAQEEAIHNTVNPQDVGKAEDVVKPQDVVTPPSEPAALDTTPDSQIQDPEDLVLSENEKLGEIEVPEAPVFIIEEMDAEKKEGAYQEIKEGETHNYFDWFKRLENNQRKKEKESGVDDLKLEDKIELFDSFVNKLPELKKKRNVPQPKKVEVEYRTSSQTGALVTETLANVYISQGHFDKAKKAYQILRLKYPEKSSFFADRIQEIENLKNSK